MLWLSPATNDGLANCAGHRPGGVT
jgi:hypothetical protein